MKDTREKILMIALDMFGEYGFNGVSTRDISKKADVNISAINYYFNSKEGLYLEVIKYIADLIKVKFQRCVDIISSCKDKPIDEKLAINIFSSLLDNISDTVLKNDMPSVSMILIREIMKPNIGTEIIYNDLVLPFHNTLLKVIKVIIGNDFSEKEITIIIHTILGQIMGFSANKAMITRMLNTDKIDDKTLFLIKETIKKQSINILNSYKKEGKK